VLSDEERREPGAVVRLRIVERGDILLAQRDPVAEAGPKSSALAGLNVARMA
jgi:hypothetical protein